MEELNRQQCLQKVTRTLVSLIIACLLLVLSFFYVKLWIDPEQTRTFLVIYVFVAGLIGGFVSIQQRLPAIGLSELRELSSSWISILLIPINGGIFAIVLMLMFLSKIIQGAMFPTFFPITIESDLDKVVESFWNWFTKSCPESGPDIAKLLFWSFVAGFSERFVPQIIRKATDKADDNIIPADEKNCG